MLLGDDHLDLRMREPLATCGTGQHLIAGSLSGRWRGEEIERPEGQVQIPNRSGFRHIGEAHVIERGIF
jgi:hypothetical protein